MYGVGAEVEQLKKDVYRLRSSAAVVLRNNPFPEFIDNEKVFDSVCSLVNTCGQTVSLVVVYFYHDSPAEYISSCPVVYIPYPHPGQIVMIRNRRKRTYIYQGRGGGKTWMLMMLAVLLTMAGREVWWFAPTHDQAMLGQDEFIKAVGEIYPRVKSRKMFTSPTGGRLFFRSLGAEGNIRGPHPDDILIDEIGQTTPNMITDVVEPMIAIKEGNLFGVGTPTEGCWVDDHFRMTEENPDTHTICFRAPAYGVEITEMGLVRKPHPLENPFYTMAAIEQLYTNPSRSEDQFRQEILAESVLTGKGTFKNIDRCSTSPMINVPDHRRRYAIGVDSGRTVDFTVFTVMDVDNRQMVDFVRLGETQWGAQEEALEELCNKWQPIALIIEINFAGQLAERMQAKGWHVIPFVANNESNLRLVDRLKVAFERCLIKIQPYPALIQELKVFIGKLLPSGRTKYEAKKDYHDDCVDSLAMVNDFCVEQGNSLVAPLSACALVPRTLEVRAAFIALDELTACIAVVSTDRRNLHVERVERLALDPNALCLEAVRTGAQIFGYDRESNPTLEDAFIRQANFASAEGRRTPRRKQVERHKERITRQLAAVQVPLASGIVTVDPRVRDENRNEYFQCDMLDTLPLDALAGAFDVLKNHVYASSA